VRVLKSPPVETESGFEAAYKNVEQLRLVRLSVVREKDRYKEMPDELGRTNKELTAAHYF